MQIQHEGRATFVSLNGNFAGQEPWESRLGYARRDEGGEWQIMPDRVVGYSMSAMDVLDGDVAFTIFDDEDNTTRIVSERAGWSTIGDPLTFTARGMLRAPDSSARTVYDMAGGMFEIARGGEPTWSRAAHSMVFDTDCCTQMRVAHISGDLVGGLWDTQHTVHYFDSDGTSELAWTHDETYLSVGPVAGVEGRVWAGATGNRSHLLFERTGPGAWSADVAFEPAPLPDIEVCPFERVPSGAPCRFPSYQDEIVGLVNWMDQPLMVRYRENAEFRYWRACLQEGFKEDTPVCVEFGDWEEPGSSGNPSCNTLIVGDDVVELERRLPHTYLLDPATLVDDQA